MLLGRDRELARITAILGEAASGRGGCLVLHGEPGIGKSALLACAEEHAHAFHVLRTVGVVAEADMPYAALHRLLLPGLGGVGELPEPQAQALRIVFGLGAGPPPDLFMVALSTLSLLSALAGDKPVLCVVDDAHWADQPSLRTLAFVARRLGDEPIAMVVAARADDGHDLGMDDLPRVPLTGLDKAATRALAARSRSRDLPEDEYARLQAVTGGNPLAIVELAGRPLANEWPDEPVPLTEQLRRRFLARARDRHADAMPLLLLIAADGSGRVAIIARAAAALGIPTAPLDQGRLDDLVTYDGTRLAYRHPLVRAAIYHGATPGERTAAHVALAGAFDDEADLHRRAWHLGQATGQPDESVAGRLEDSAEQAVRIAGPAAATAALTRAAELSPPGAARVRRFVLAARSALQGGSTRQGVELLDRAEQASPGSAGPERAARRGTLETAGLRASLENLTGAPEEALDILRPWVAEGSRAERRYAVSLSVLFAEVTSRVNRPDAWRDIAAWLQAEDLGGADAEAALLRVLLAASRAHTGHRSHLDPADRARLERLDDSVLLTMAGGVAMGIGDHELARRLLKAAERMCRTRGSVAVLAWTLERLAFDEIAHGRLAAAEASAEEGLGFATEIGHRNTACRHRGLLALCAALRGRAGDARGLADEVLAEATGRLLADAMAHARRALGLVDLIEGHHREAARHFAEIGGADDPTPTGLALAAMPDLVEALVRAGERDRAAEAAPHFAAWAERAGSAGLRALAARCRALVATGDEATAAYREGVRLHATAGSPLEQARTELLFGQHLRRERHRSEAQPLLRGAAETFRRIGALAWADRAQEELRAAGESTDAPAAGVLTTFTPQEHRIAMAVGEGLTNREIAARLFLSPRTVDYHLRKVFQKAGLTSRNELMRLLLSERGPG